MQKSNIIFRWPENADASKSRAQVARVDGAVMSSTQRGRPREISDYYVTPHWAIHQFLLEFQKYEILKGPVLDPCAGGDKLHVSSYPHVLQADGYLLEGTPFDTLDIRTDSRAGNKGVNYLDWRAPKDWYNMIITNPPFALAEKIILKALRDVREGGFVIMLLRLNFFGSQRRLNFWKHNPAWATFVHPKRMSFTPDGKTDSIEYMHCVWIKGADVDYTQLKVLTTQNRYEAERSLKLVRE